ncbi:hypothetical protein VTP01DRAFT_1839 [Rhizomucor pusillus]|uniref:uncharacterized protein n=1 Tax=Rhizomucor pusillus TaxID=4840 RepID=UPI0037435E23
MCQIQRTYTAYWPVVTPPATLAFPSWKDLWTTRHLWFHRSSHHHIMIADTTVALVSNIDLPIRNSRDVQREGRQYAAPMTAEVAAIIPGDDLDQS